MDSSADAQRWDERYRAKPVWSGEPNPHLVAETLDLIPGRAFDAGSGEGADAIWLAQHGWLVDAVDFSAVALERAEARALEIAPAAADRITWVRADLTTWAPPASYDLVSAQFMQLPREPREELFRRLAAAVAPGGTLLVVGHDPSDRATTVRRPPDPELYFTSAEVAATLERNRWTIVVDERRARQATDADDALVTVHDTVLRARRRA